MQRVSQPIRLVTDVGGTNTRIALFDPARDEFRAFRSYINRDFAGLEDIIEHWQNSVEEPTPGICCMAVAAPPSEDLVVMSNIDWSFSVGALASRFGLRQVRRLNDFEANAYALPHLESCDRKQLYPGAGDHSGRLATAGPGTGLARLHQALGEINGAHGDRLRPEDISRLALEGDDPLCVQALQTFCALLGSACGDFLLASGSYGGLYLAGGIVRRLTTFVGSSEFHRRMVEKGPMRDTLARVPVYLLISEQPGLIGAAHAPMQ